MRWRLSVVRCFVCLPRGRTIVAVLAAYWPGRTGWTARLFSCFVVDFVEKVNLVENYAGSTFL